MLHIRVFTHNHIHQNFIYTVPLQISTSAKLRAIPVPESNMPSPKQQKRSMDPPIANRKDDPVPGEGGVVSVHDVPGHGMSGFISR